MKKYSFIKIVYLVVFLFLGSFSLSTASSTDNINVNLIVSNCNYDLICDPIEDYISCPTDCPAPIPPPTPPPSPSSGSSGSSVALNTFNNLTIEVGYNNAVIKWKSNVPIMSNVKWGLSPNYEDGIISSADFSLDHRIEINNLKDGTLYYFTIEAKNLLRQTNLLDNQFFVTLSLPDTTPPSNPTNVVAESGASGVTIYWDNPKENDFDYVRVMRNKNRFYGSPDIGDIAYEGSGKYFIDSKVVENNKYYYSLFSRDRAGNYSSGSLISILYNSKGEDFWNSNIVQIENIEKPLLNNYKVIQGASTYDFNIGSIISLRSDENIKVKTDYSSKTLNDDMWIEIIDKNNIANRYFFSRTKDLNGFIVADVPPFSVGGYYSVNIYKYSDKTTEIVNQGAFLVSSLPIEKNNNNYFWYFIWIIIIIFILLVIWLFLTIYRRKISQ